MKNFDFSDFENCLSDPSFREWISKGDFDCEDCEWTTRLRQNPEHIDVALRARAIILAAKVEKQDISKEFVDEVVNKTLLAVRGNQKRVIDWTNRNFIGIAASVFLVLALLGYFASRELVSNNQFFAKSSTNNDIQTLVLKNTSLQVKPVALPDGSSVLLDPEAEIEYPSEFGADDRIIHLNGSAFFEITKDPKRPFLVKAGDVETRVLGTSFKINKGKNNYSVIVKSGKVEVKSTKKDAKPLELTLNQEAVYDLESDIVTKKEVDEELIKQSTPDNTREIFFNDVPINQIFESLSENYKVPIKIEGSSFSECSLTTSFTDEPLFEKIKIICQAIGPSTSFEVQNHSIIIKTKGCNN